jgi:hypothetical protein
MTGSTSHVTLRRHLTKAAHNPIVPKGTMSAISGGVAGLISMSKACVRVASFGAVLI